MAPLFKKTLPVISLELYKNSIHKKYATASLMNPFNNYEAYCNFYLVSQYQGYCDTQHIDSMKSIKPLAFARDTEIMESFPVTYL